MHVSVIIVVRNRYCRPQRPRLRAPPQISRKSKKGGGQGLGPSWPPWQTYWIFNELFDFLVFATQTIFFFFFLFGEG